MRGALLAFRLAVEERILLAVPEPEDEGFGLARVKNEGTPSPYDRKGAQVSVTKRFRSPAAAKKAGWKWAWNLRRSMLAPLAGSWVSEPAVVDERAGIMTFLFGPKVRATMSVWPIGVGE